MKITVCKGCGQAMMARDKNGNPACITCFGLSPDNSVPIEVEAPDVAKCIYCKATRKVSPDLPFYDSRTNTYYCGCRGWD